MSVDEDILAARKIIGEKKTEATLFYENSSVYKNTNENINDDRYLELIKDMDSILSVIGSGDQILNSILLGSHDIDAFDISRFPKYFLDLKIAAVKVLDYEAFLSFFYGSNSFDRRTLKKVTMALKGDSKLFWDSIIDYNFFSFKKGQFRPRDVYNSNMFISENNTVKSAIGNNPYLSKSEYYSLRSKIDGARIRYFRGNITNLARTIDKSYDLVNLSNICMYQPEMNMFFTGNYEARFKKMITNFSLNPNGRVLNYIMCYKPGSASYRYIDKFFRNDSSFDISIVKTEHNYDDALVVYNGR